MAHPILIPQEIYDYDKKVYKWDVVVKEIMSPFIMTAIDVFNKQQYDTRSNIRIIISGGHALSYYFTQRLFETHDFDCRLIDTKRINIDGGDEDQLIAHKNYFIDELANYLNNKLGEHLYPFVPLLNSLDPFKNGGISPNGISFKTKHYNGGRGLSTCEIYIQTTQGTESDSVFDLINFPLHPFSRQCLWQPICVGISGSGNCTHRARNS